MILVLMDIIKLKEMVNNMVSINDLMITDKIIYVNDTIAGVDSLGMRQLQEEKSIQNSK